MNIIRHRRLRGGPLGYLHHEMNDLVGRFFEDCPFTGLAWDACWPAIDIADQDDKVVVRAELPGVDSGDINISVQDDVLTISGEKKETSQDKGVDYHYVERHYGSFRRTIQLPSAVDPEKIEATCRKGILTVNLAKSQQAKARQIKIKT